MLSSLGAKFLECRCSHPGFPEGTFPRAAGWSLGLRPRAGGVGEELPRGKGSGPLSHAGPWQPEPAFWRTDCVCPADGGRPGRAESAGKLDQPSSGKCRRQEREREEAWGPQGRPRSGGKAVGFPDSHDSVRAGASSPGVAGAGGTMGERETFIFSFLRLCTISSVSSFSSLFAYLCHLKENIRTRVLRKKPLTIKRKNPGTSPTASPETGLPSAAGSARQGSRVRKALGIPAAPRT